MRSKNDRKGKFFAEEKLKLVEQLGKWNIRWQRSDQVLWVYKLFLMIVFLELERLL